MRVQQQNCLTKKKKNNIQDTWKKKSIKKQSIKAYQMKEKQNKIR